MWLTWFVSYRYSEILDYHNVENGGDGQAMEMNGNWIIVGGGRDIAIGWEGAKNIVAWEESFELLSDELLHGNEIWYRVRRRAADSSSLLRLFDYCSLGWETGLGFCNLFIFFLFLHYSVAFCLLFLWRQHKSNAWKRGKSDITVAFFVSGWLGLGLDWTGWK